MTVSTLLFFPFDIGTKRAERVFDWKGCSRKERDILILSLGEEERNRRQTNHGCFSRAHRNRPDDGDDASVPDPASAADGEVAASLCLTHPEHLSLIPGGAVAGPVFVEERPGPR